MHFARCAPFSTQSENETEPICAGNPAGSWLRLGFNLIKQMGERHGCYDNTTSRQLTSLR